MTDSDDSELARAQTRVAELEGLLSEAEILRADDLHLLARQRALFDRAVDSIVLHNVQGEILDANEATWRALGMSRQELMDANVRDFDLELQKIPLERYGESWAGMELGKTLVVESDHRRKDGTIFPVEIRVRPFEEDGTRLFVATMSDISQRRALEGQREAMMETLEQLVEDRTAQLGEANGRLRAEVDERQRAETLAVDAKEDAERASQAKSQFLANMSHELRTPLNAVIGYSELLQEEAEDLGEERMIKDLEKIRGAGKHLLSIINDILDLSKVEAGRMEMLSERVDLEALLRDTLSTAKPLADKNGNALILKLQGDPGAAMTDGGRVRQVLLNLLSNACKFTDKGQVTISVSRETAIEPGRGVAREFFVVSVQDNGIGITEEQLTRLFNPFTQADGSTTRKYGGTGLGLSISRKFCELLGGQLTAESSYGAGSTFTMRLPYGAPVSEAPPPSRPIYVDAAGKTVLVVDDDDDARELLAHALVSEGYAVSLAASGQEALDKARASLPDAVTLDVLMPDMDGWQVLGEFKRDPKLKDVPVVIVSMSHDRSSGIALGAADYLSKPVDRSALMRALGRHAHPMNAAGVLVIDDDRHARAVIRRALERDGWTVTESVDGLEGLEKMRAEPPAAVVLDLMMPQLDGFGVLEGMRQDAGLREIPVIVVTSKDLTHSEREWLSARVFRVMEAGSREHDELLGEVRGLVGQCIKRSRVSVSPKP